MRKLKSSASITTVDDMKLSPPKLCVRISGMENKGDVAVGVYYWFSKLGVSTDEIYFRQLETKCIFSWDLNKWNCPLFSYILSLKWLGLILSGVVVVAAICKGLDDRCRSFSVEMIYSILTFLLIFTWKYFAWSRLFLSPSFQCSIPLTVFPWVLVAGHMTTPQSRA